MAITSNPKLEYESGQAFHAFEEMSDSGDATTFEASFAPWSGRSGFEATVLPFGLATGGQVSPDTGTSDSVAVAASTAYLPGTAGADADGLVSVSSDTVSVSRAVSDTHMITSIIINASGAYAAESGSEGTAFSETRGAAGGPPLIPVDAVEIAQVRLSTQGSDPVADTEIHQVVGTHQERYDAPVMLEPDAANGEVTFVEALPAIHTGEVPKKVYVRGYSPQFAEMPRIADFVPAEYAYSSSSTDTSTGPVTSSSRSTANSTFTYHGLDGITDPIVSLEGANLWFRWYQDRNRLPHLLQQGQMGFARNFAMGESPQFAVTLIPTRNAIPRES